MCYVRQRELEIKKMITDYWGEFPENLELVLTENVTLKIIDDFFDSEFSEEGLEPELSLVSYFRAFRLKDHKLEKKVFDLGRNIRKIESSTGTLVLTHPHEEGTGEEIMTIQDEQGQEVVLFSRQKYLMRIIK